MHHGPVGRVERPTGAEFNRADAWSGGDVSSLVRTRQTSESSARAASSAARRAWWFPCRCVIGPERERDAAGRVPPPVPLGHRDPSLRVLFAHHVHGVTPTTSSAPGARMSEWSMAGSSHSRYSADGGQPERERFWRMRFLAASIVAVTPRHSGSFVFLRGPAWGSERVVFASFPWPPLRPRLHHRPRPPRGPPASSCPHRKASWRERVDGALDRPLTRDGWAARVAGRRAFRSRHQRGQWASVPHLLCHRVL